MIAVAMDAGGTSTRCVVLDGDGTCLGYGRSGSGNPVSSGVLVAAASAAASARDAFTMAGVSPREADVWLVAMAGGVADAEVELFREPMRGLGLGLPPVFEGDAMATFRSGTWQDSGYALIVGTGATAVRFEDGRLVAACDGLGWLLGDDGSGFWIGHRVVRAGLAALENRGPATRLAELVGAELVGVEVPARALEGRAPQIAAAIEALYRGRPVELARFARLAFQAAPDPVADRIVAEAAEALAATVSAVITGGAPGPVVLGGGMLTHNPALAAQVIRALPPGVATEVHSVPDGLSGAAGLALRAAGTPVDAAVFERITGTLAALRVAC